MTAARVIDDAVLHTIRLVTTRNDGTVDQQELFIGNNRMLVITARMVAEIVPEKGQVEIGAVVTRVPRNDSVEVLAVPLGGHQSLVAAGRTAAEVGIRRCRAVIQVG